jgi:PTH1 family peptidyl-tRNA hydrolase
MKLIVGLGNPGQKYLHTRHNVGFEVVNRLSRIFGVSRPKLKFKGELVEAVIKGHPSRLLCPHTYMNRSGASVRAARNFYKVDDGDLLVVSDDLNLPLARLRFRARGSAGGQKGLADIINCLGTQEFPRLRIGIGTPPDNWDAADYVLSKFSSDEAKAIEAAFSCAADAIEHWVSAGIDDSMNKYNSN